MRRGFRGQLFETLTGIHGFSSLIKELFVEIEHHAVHRGDL
jgi:hypothetical protein